MEWVMFLLIIAMISSVMSKQDSLSKKIDDIKFDENRDKKKKNPLNLDEYLNKNVCIEIDNDEINNSHLFSSIYNTSGKIVDYDNEWLEFRYKDKSKNRIVNKYFRIRDVISINEIK